MCVCDEVHSYVTLMTHLNTWIFCYLNLQINCKRKQEELVEEQKNSPKNLAYTAYFATDFFMITEIWTWC